MPGLVEITLPQQPEITHYRTNSQNASIYLILGTRLLETLSLHYFCGTSPHFQKLSNAIREMFILAQSKYSNIAENVFVLNQILNNITVKASNAQQSLGWISGYAQNNNYSAHISLVFKHVLWTTCRSLANREYDHCMLDEVLQTYSEIFQIKIILLSISGEKRCFYDEKSGTCPVMLLLGSWSNIFSVYSKEMLAIENGSEKNLQVILQSPQMMSDAIPSPSPGNGSLLQGDMSGTMQNTLPPKGKTATSSGKRFREACMQSCGKKYVCCICGEIGNIEKVVPHKNGGKSHICPDCYAVKVINREESCCCNNGHTIAMYASEKGDLNCVYCKKLTLLCNFLEYKDEVLGGISCKRCWSDWCYQENTMQHKVSIEKLTLNLRADKAHCKLGRKEEDKPYTDLVWPMGCMPCYQHFHGRQRMHCSQELIGCGKCPW